MMMNRLSLWIGGVVVIAIILYLFLGSGVDTNRIRLAVTCAAILVIVLYALVVLIAIATGEIQISALLTESGGGASMSRFQLLIFTLTIALCFVLYVVTKTDFPKLPPEVLELLGISASTFAVSKGIQASGGLKPKTDTTSGQGNDKPPPAGNP
jgi:ABC-type Fe3+-siderophore transport system permease subunit